VFKAAAIVKTGSEGISEMVGPAGSSDGAFSRTYNAPGAIADEDEDDDEEPPGAWATTDPGAKTGKRLKLATSRANVPNRYGFMRFPVCKSIGPPGRSGEIPAQAKLRGCFVQFGLGEEELMLRVGVWVKPNDNLRFFDGVALAVVKRISQIL
jgi:hypothetical protein